MRWATIGPDTASGSGPPPVKPDGTTATHVPMPGFSLVMVSHACGRCFLRPSGHRQHDGERRSDQERRFADARFIREVAYRVLRLQKAGVECVACGLMFCLGFHDIHMFAAVVFIIRASNPENTSPSSDTPEWLSLNVLSRSMTNANRDDLPGKHKMQNRRMILRQNLFHHVPMHIRKAEVAAMGAVGELGVIEA